MSIRSARATPPIVTSRPLNADAQPPRDRMRVAASAAIFPTKAPLNGAAILRKRNATAGAPNPDGSHRPKPRVTIGDKWDSVMSHNPLNDRSWLGDTI